VLNVSRALKAWRDTGALNENIPLWGFIDNELFLTKNGSVGAVLHVGGIDPESLSSNDLDVYTKRFEAALRIWDPTYRVYQYLFRRNCPHIHHRYYGNPTVDAAIRARVDHFTRKACDLYELDLYYVVLHEGHAQKPGFIRALGLLAKDPRLALDELAGLFSSTKRVRLIESDIDRATAQLRKRLDTFLAQLADFMPIALLDKDAAFLFFRRLLNPDPRKASAPGRRYDTHLDFFVADTTLEAERDHLRLDDYYVRIVTLKDSPTYTIPFILRRLYDMNANYHIVTEWQAEPQEASRVRLDRHRRHFHSGKTSFASQLSDQPALIDTSKSAMISTLDACKAELDKGNNLGEYSLTVVIYDTDHARVNAAVGEVYKALASCDASVYEERWNQLNAFFATIPGNTIPYNLRRLYLLNTNAADIAFVFLLATGNPVNPHLNGEYLALLETRYSTPYYLNLHVGDVGHTLVLGMTGAGKSFLLNFLAANAQKYGGHTFMLEIGGSFKGLCNLFGGRYLKIGDREGSDVRINPFALPADESNFQFLNSFVRVLLEGRAVEGRTQYNLTIADERNVRAAIDDLFQLEPRIRTLSTLATLLPRELAELLHLWIHGGPHAWLFDNPQDNLQVARIQAWDLEGLDRYPELLQPLLFYLLHRTNAVIYDPAIASVPKFFFLDEAWRFLGHPVTRAYITEALKTWRKRNATVIISTQSLADLRTQPDLLNILLESCPTRLFLANPQLDPDWYRETFHLTDIAVQLLQALIPKKQFLLSRPDHTKVLTLDVDPRSYWIYTNDANDNVRRAEALARCASFDAALDELVSQRKGAAQ
jgi:type IV secretion/conjugal transfer VirB4 family ATPase